MSDNKDVKKVKFDRKTGEIDIIVDEEDLLFASVPPEIAELIQNIDENNERFAPEKNNEQ